MATFTANALSLAILAGGQGARLGGVEKGLLKKGGRTLVERLLELDLPRAEALLVTDRPGPYAFLGGRVRVVHDAVSGKGPASGLVAALLEATTPYVLAVACDQAGLTAGALEPLLSTGAEARCYRVGEVLEPFPGLYAKALGERWRPLLEGAPGPRALLSQAQLAAVDARALEAWGGASILRSVNTASDLVELGVEAGS